MSKVKWIPAVLMGVGAMLILGIDGQKEMQLPTSLGEMVDASVSGYSYRDIQLSDEEKTVAGFSDYVLREYTGADDSGRLPYSVYLGYYASQTQGRSIHSPKNCLPGGGWEALASSVVSVNVAGASIDVNHYVVQNGDAQAVVLYWYQGRGRIEASEYKVKWNLLADAALRGRTDEALVRIVVPVPEQQSDLSRSVEILAKRVAEQVIPELNSALSG